LDVLPNVNQMIWGGGPCLSTRSTKSESLVIDVRRFEIREILQHLVSIETGGKKIKDVDNTDTHPTDAGTSAALPRVEGDPGFQIRHASLRSMGLRCATDKGDARLHL
jgi:hypothetical protein